MRNIFDWLVETWIELLVYGAVAVFVVGFPLALWYEGTERYQRPNYEAWIRLTHSDISITDWNRLRKQHLLPGQPPEPTTVYVHTEDP